MKKALPFILTLMAGIGFFITSKQTNNSCLFYHQNKCYRETEKDIFFVGLPENCQPFKNKNSQYLEWGDLSIWACLPENQDEEDIIPSPPVQNNLCPKDYPLMDVLGHCYSCNTEQAVQVAGFDYSVCLGKRYLTKFRNSSKNVSPRAKSWLGWRWTMRQKFFPPQEAVPGAICSACLPLLPSLLTERR